MITGPGTSSRRTDLFRYLLADNAEEYRAVLAAAPAHGDTAEQPRRSLRRKLVENLLVRREDLTDAERDALSRERTELTRVLEDSFGLILEVRLEGALAYDPDSELSDLLFPAGGTVRHAALLLLNALIDDLKVASDSKVIIDGRDVPGALAPWTLVRTNIDLLLTQYGGAFSGAYSADPEQLQRDVVSLLDALSLTRSLPDGLALDPAAARYRPEPTRAPAPTRAAQRLIATTSAPQAEPLGLFDIQIFQENWATCGSSLRGAGPTRVALST